jgi:hypothetical protein
VIAALGEGLAETGLDPLELLELAWHDCYGEVTPSDEVIDDVLLLSGGTLRGLITAARLAVTDWRDLKVTAQELRDRP